MGGTGMTDAVVGSGHPGAAKPGAAGPSTPGPGAPGGAGPSTAGPGTAPMVRLPPEVAAAHQAAVAALRESYQALPAGAPVRLAKRTSNLFRFRDPAPRAQGRRGDQGSAPPVPGATAGLDASA